MDRIYTLAPSIIEKIHMQNLIQRMVDADKVYQSEFICS